MAQSLDTAETAGGSPLGETVVIDADVHLSYNDEIRRAVAAYMDEPWSRYTHPETGDGYPSHGWPKSLGGKRRFHLVDVDTPAAIQGPLCEEFGVDYPIINTSAPLNQMVTADRAVAEMRAVNDMLLDRFLDEYDHFYGLASVVTRRPEAAAEEIDRIGDEDDIVGVYLYHGEYMDPLGDPSHDVMWRAMEDNGLTPTYHISGHIGLSQMAVFRQFEHNFEWHALAGPFGGMLQLTSLLAHGVPEKFPGLDFVIQEADFGWLPGMIARLNREYAEWTDELPLLERSPEEYIRDAFYFTTQPMGEFRSASDMRSIIDLVGAESLLYSSDHPHYDFDTPETLDRFLQQLSAEERDAVLHGNAAEIYGIDV